MVVQSTRHTMLDKYAGFYNFTMTKNIGTILGYNTTEEMHD